jgi:hypothetical protein
VVDVLAVYLVTTTGVTVRFVLVVVVLAVVGFVVLRRRRG